jgi:hypothetical protein
MHLGKKYVLLATETATGTGHTSEGNEEQCTGNQPGATSAKEAGSGEVGSREPASSKEIPNIECPGNATQPPRDGLESEGPKEMEVDGDIQKTNGETACALAEKPVSPKGSKGEEMDLLPFEGRRDPTSTMLWSPRKYAGHKRPLESEGEECEK